MFQKNSENIPSQKKVMGTSFQAILNIFAKKNFPKIFKKWFKIMLNLLQRKSCSPWPKQYFKRNPDAVRHSGAEIEFFDDLSITKNGRGPK